ncbi:MAG: hypothetical protein ACT4RN_23825, partial [Pseudonocardia sp.]
MPRYLLHGLRVDSEVPLAHDRTAPSGAAADLVVRCAGRRPVPDTLADGTLMQGVAADGRLRQSITRTPGGGACVRVHGLVDFEVAADLREVRVWRDPAAAEEMVAILAIGHLVAAVLALRGETVLHASAVEVDGDAVAFVADSGGGKSTMAALCSARGARFVTDDVLRHRVGAAGARCFAGATQNRL